MAGQTHLESRPPELDRGLRAPPARPSPGQAALGSPRPRSLQPWSPSWAGAMGTRLTASGQQLTGRSPLGLLYPCLSARQFYARSPSYRHF